MKRLLNQMLKQQLLQQNLEFNPARPAATTATAIEILAAHNSPFSEMFGLIFFFKRSCEIDVKLPKVDQQLLKVLQRVHPQLLIQLPKLVNQQFLDSLKP